MATKARKRTTHSDLANLLDDLAIRLEAIPAGFGVSDGSTLKLVRDAATVIYDQDVRIDGLNVAVRDSITTLRDALARTPR